MQKVRKRCDRFSVVALVNPVFNQVLLSQQETETSAYLSECNPFVAQVPELRIRLMWKALSEQAIRRLQILRPLRVTHSCILSTDSGDCRRLVERLHQAFCGEVPPFERRH